MNPEDRRSFLKRLAKSAAYAAPVIQSFAEPADLVGQGKSSMKGGMGAASFEPDPAPSPWNAPAPGMQP